MKHFDLTISSDDLNAIIYSLSIELGTLKELHCSFAKYEPDSDSAHFYASQIDSLERMIHIFRTSGKSV